MITTYEKHNVKGGMQAVVTGFVDFNVLNQPRKPKATQLVPDPKPEYVIALSEFNIKGDKNLVDALKETAYDNGKKISLRDKSPYAPQLFGSDRQGGGADEIIPDGKALKQGEPVKVHVKAFDTPLNVGCGFDAVMVGVPLSDLKLTSVGTVTADVFDLDNDATTVDWNNNEQ